MRRPVPRAACVLLPLLLPPGGEALPLSAFATRSAATMARSAAASPTALSAAAPRRLAANAPGVLYVNDRCIDCAACAHFAPDVFGRSSPEASCHVVRAQPAVDDGAQVDRARAALSACPVGAIRVENRARTRHAASVAAAAAAVAAGGGRAEVVVVEEEEEASAEERRALADQLALSPAFNGLDPPFPRPAAPLSVGGDEVSFAGSHNEASFGATPYLARGRGPGGGGRPVTVLIDAPRCTPAAVRAVLEFSGGDDPDYLLLTHVDDTAGHVGWVERFPSLRRIFHSGDLGTANWLRDEALEDVEVLLGGGEEPGGGGVGGRAATFAAWDLDGNPTEGNFEGEGGAPPSWPEGIEGDFVVLHTPGHSPGSISLLQRTRAGLGVLFTGDTYAKSGREGRDMTGFPQYCKGSREGQIGTLRMILSISGVWDVIAPGHGHVRDYAALEGDAARVGRIKRDEMEAAIEELGRVPSNHK